VAFFVLYNMCNIGAVMHWCFDCTNKCHSNYFICLRSVIWIVFRKLDQRRTGSNV